FHDSATPDIYTLSLHDALPISGFIGFGLKQFQAGDPMRICIFSGSSNGISPEYRIAAAGLGRLLARNSVELVYGGAAVGLMGTRSEEHTSELQSRENLVCRLLL